MPITRERQRIKRHRHILSEKMAVLPCNEEEVDWNVDMEVQLFHAMRGHKPVGVNRYFQMACIHEKFSNSINKEISSKQIWLHLDTMYDMAALHESEILPFPNEQSDFDLPEIEFGELISRKLDDLPLSQSLTPKGNEAIPSKTNNNNSATPVTKPPKNVAPVKVNQNHSTPSTNKLGKDLIGQKLSVPLTPLSPKLGKNEIVKSDTKLPRESNSTQKSKPDGTPVVKVNKSVSLTPSKVIKTESSNTSQKSSKQETSGENANKKANKQEAPKKRSESSDGAPQKKVKNDSEKKSKPEISDVSSGKKSSKVESVNGAKKQKLDNNGVKKSVDSAGLKHSKADGKSNQPSTPKGQKVEEDSSSSTASSKSTKVQGKGDGSDNPNKRKRQKVDEKKASASGGTPAAKRRRT